MCTCVLKLLQCHHPPKLQQHIDNPPNYRGVCDDGQCIKLSASLNELVTVLPD